MLFITGLCSKHCFYCPISDKKWQKDSVYANEWKISSFSQLVKEIELCSSQGVGITGGDPLMRLERTCEYMRNLKSRFGKRFHIHLYTPLDLVDEEKLGMLYEAGLDEIRLNPDLDLKKKGLWKRILTARKFPWQVGVEIPVIPGYRKVTEKLIDYIIGKVDFLNLNELEISDSNSNKLMQMGFKTKDSLSYAVMGSEAMALQLLKYLYAKKGLTMKVNYCTAKLKDNVQLRSRIMLRAENQATRFDALTEDGTLLRTVAYLKDLAPGFGYSRMLESLTGEKRNELKEQIENANKTICGIPDYDRFRIIIGKDMVARAKSLQGIVVASVEEYPTQDAMLVRVEFI